jgi:ureidoacrylate peracid hydrolase
MADMQELREKLDARFDPTRCALLVVDVQRYFTRQRPTPMYPPVDEVLDRLKRFVDACRARGVLLVRIQNVISEESALGAWRRHFGERWGTPSPLTPDQPGAQFHPGFGPEAGDLVLTKSRYSAFHGMSMASILRSRGVEAVIVGGLTTDVCVSGPARDAFQHEFDVVTLSDCTAEVTQAGHESGLATLAANFGIACPSTDVLATWNNIGCSSDQTVTSGGGGTQAKDA